MFLHVGAPKTGTTFLQGLLWDNRETLRAEHGLLYPGDRYDEHFFAAVDLQQLDFHGMDRPEAAGAWERLATAAREWPGTAVISHDVFASATAEQAQQAVADLAPADVHVVFTARDLARQLVSHWQEDVKHGSADHFEQWWRAVSRRDASKWEYRWFWATEEIPDIVARWGSAVGADHFHLVTVPRSGAPRSLLWERFCSVIGLDPASVDLETAIFANQSLGVAEVEVLRRDNEHLDGSITQVVYEFVVKGVLAHETLPRHRSDRRLVLPTQNFTDVERLAQDWVAALTDAGIDVVGDLADLFPQPAGPDATGIDDISDRELADASVWALHEVLLRLERERVDHRHAIEAVRAEAQRQEERTGRPRRVLRRPRGA